MRFFGRIAALSISSATSTSVALGPAQAQTDRASAALAWGARASASAHCGNCRHRDPDRAALEVLVPGLTSFGSGFGASVADSRLCRLHDRLISPGDRCGAFDPLT